MLSAASLATAVTETASRESTRSYREGERRAVFLFLSSASMSASRRPSGPTEHRSPIPIYEPTDQSLPLAQDSTWTSASTMVADLMLAPTPPTLPTLTGSLRTLTS